MADTSSSHPTRRAVIARLASAAGVAGAAALAMRCRRRAKRPAGPHVTVPLSDIPDHGRRVVQVDDQPIEILRRGTTLEARLLLCTHMGCPVAWIEAERRYHCPGHGGRFDAAGRAVEGSPTRALDHAPVFLDGDMVTVYTARGVRGSSAALPGGAASPEAPGGVG
jgi:cytochrome b6-f complex iron-sulfur subunit